jgi:site-specific recombinase XerD
VKKPLPFNNDPDVMRILKSYFRVIASGNPTDDTERVYTSRLRHFFLWCEEHIPKLHPFHLEIDDLLDFRNDMLRKAKKDYTTVIHYVNVINGFYAIAVKRGAVGPEFAELNKELKPPKDKDSGIRKFPILNAVEKDKLLRFLPLGNNEEDQRLRAAIYLMLGQGMRVVELHRLSMGDINIEERSLKVSGKGKSRIVYLRDDSWEEFSKYIMIRQNVITDMNGSPIFVATGNRSGGRRLSRESLRAITNVLYTKAGIKEEGRSCHSLRHTFGTELYQKTKDIRAVQEELGHAQIETTKLYTHVVDRAKNRLSEKISLNRPNLGKELPEENNIE